MPRANRNRWMTPLALLLGACGGGGTAPPPASPPAISQQPVAVAVVAGATASFSVVASGSAPLSYQWQRDGQALAGATGASYTTPPTTVADNGASFRVVVGNAGGSVTSDAATLRVTATALAPTITTPPSNQSVPAGQAATFRVVATGTAPLRYAWQKNGQLLAGASAASYTTPATSAADNGAVFTVTVSNAAGSAAPASATLTVTAAVAGVDVLTYHNDNLRTAQNLAETQLTPASVTATGFGLLRTLPADGLVDAQPLVVSGLAVQGMIRNVVYVASEHGTLYAYDADAGTLLASASLLGSGETPSDDRGCGQVSPEIGITATPVIDRGAGSHGTIFAVAMSKDASGRYHQRLHALDLATLAEQPGSPAEIAATFPGTGAGSSGGSVVFDPKQYKERAALTLVGGRVYTAWASHCDIDPYTSWVIGYDELSLAPVAVLNLVPNGSEGAIWQAGGGPAADAAGSLYLLTGNGTFDVQLDAQGFPSQRNFGNAFVRLSTGGSLAVADYFAESNDVSESQADVDLGSGAPLLLPDVTDGGGVTRHLAVGAGKDGHLYVVDRDHLGGFSPSGNPIWQDLPGALPGGIWSAPAYFQGSVYYADVGGTLKAFRLDASAKFGATPASQSAASFPYPGASPAVSASGTANAIVWAAETPAQGPGVLHAYDPANLAHEYYNSNQAANGRDHFTGNKFVTPTVANGKVYLGTPSGVAVFGLNPP